MRSLKEFMTTMFAQFFKKTISFFLPYAKAFFKWAWKGNDNSHFKRAVLLCLLGMSLMAAIIFGYLYIKLSNKPHDYPGAPKAFSEISKP